MIHDHFFTTTDEARDALERAFPGLVIIDNPDHPIMVTNHESETAA